MPTLSLFSWLHNKATRAEVIKFNRLYFQPGPSQPLAMSIEACRDRIAVQYSRKLIMTLDLL